MMERRAMLQAAVATGLAALAGGATAAAKAPAGHDHDHAHMHHHDHAANPYQALALAAADCVLKGEQCIAHCLVLLANGDTAMAECAQTVNQMLPVCRALQSLAAQASGLTPALARVALEACQQCETACRKHADKHAECKACLDACLECARLCKALAA